MVVFLGGGVGEKHVDRDGLGLSGCHRVYGAGDHLARLSITGDAQFIDGDDGNVIGLGKRPAGAHEPVLGVTVDARCPPVYKHAERRGNGDDREGSRDLAGLALGRQHGLPNRLCKVTGQAEGHPP